MTRGRRVNAVTRGRRVNAVTRGRRVNAVTRGRRVNAVTRGRTGFLLGCRPMLGERDSELKPVSTAGPRQVWEIRGRPGNGL